MTAKKPTAAKKSAPTGKPKSATPKPQGDSKPVKKSAAKSAPATKATAPPKAKAPKAKPAAKGATVKAPAAKATAAKVAPAKAPKASAPGTKAATTGTKAKSAPKSAPKPQGKAPAGNATPSKANPDKAPAGKASAVKKLLGKKSVKPVKAAPVEPPPKVLSNKEKLAKLLAMRAADTKTISREAAEGLRKGTGSSLVPSSVHKAAEFAETRKISSILKSGKRSAKDEAPATAAPKKIKKRKLPYSKAELRELRDILESERTRLLRDLAVMNDVATSSEENMSRSFSNHQADAATDSSALETTFVTRRYEEERLSQVTRALERLEAGTYGLCEMCAEEPQKRCETCPFIPIGRLRAKPFAILCLPLRQELEKKNRR